MNRDERAELVRELEKVLPYKRFIHTMGVAYTASALGMKYGIDISKCELAGLLHDCAKNCSLSEMTRICRAGKEEIREPEKDSKALLHSKAGAVLARTKYGVTDDDIINAVRYHTTGRPGMSPLEKIIFTSDYIEPGRDQAVHLDELRQCAFEDLDEAVCRILEDTLNFLESSGSSIDPQTQITYDYYRNLKLNRDGKNVSDGKDKNDAAE